MRMPKAVVIPIAVGLRFMPSFFVEYAAIRDAARLRGVSISPQNLLTKPALTLECAYVPILMRSLTISDALAASACTRGLDNPNQRSSLHTSKIGFQDIAAYAILAAFVAALVYFRSF
jgi:energy-coupling factor transport system permease protein